MLKTLKRLLIFSCVFLCFTACLSIPDYRETDDSVDPDLHLLEEISDESVPDAFISCDSVSDTTDDGTCLDQSLVEPLDQLVQEPLDEGRLETDLFMDCESNDMLCQDTDLGAADMQINDHSEFISTKWIRMRRNGYLEAAGDLVSSSLGCEP